MIKVLRGGLETTIQDYPGRIGYRGYGVSPAGPLDALSFRIGNTLLGNNEGAAGLEIQFVGPKLRFEEECYFVIAGANNKPCLNETSTPLWTIVGAEPGAILSFGFAQAGARTYLLFAGGIDVSPVMGSRATHVASRLGGLNGCALKEGDELPLSPLRHTSGLTAGMTIAEREIPEFTNHWQVRVTLGPHDDYLSGDDRERFFSSDWKVSSKSNRIGYRLEGPDFEFSEKAHAKSAVNGEDLSNIIDYGCPTGAVNICGHTAVVLLLDGPSSTGYISPFTVVSEDLRKVGQSRPGDTICFQLTNY